MPLRTGPTLQPAAASRTRPIHHRLASGVVLIAFAACLAVAPVGADEGDVGEESGTPDYMEQVAIAFDVALLRPFGVWSTAMGGTFFLATLPLTLPFGNFEAARETFIDAPFEYAFHRKLGDF